MTTHLILSLILFMVLAVLQIEGKVADWKDKADRVASQICGLMSMLKSRRVQLIIVLLVVIALIAFLFYFFASHMHVTINYDII